MYLDQAKDLLSTTQYWVERVGHDQLVTVRWNGRSDQAFKLYFDITGDGKQTQGCAKCHVKVLNRLRQEVGLPSVKKEDHSLIEKRLKVCYDCPIYNARTWSCGRLILDGIKPKPIMVDGKEIHPCGCVVKAKAAFPSETCPAGFWPVIPQPKSNVKESQSGQGDEDSPKRGRRKRKVRGGRKAQGSDHQTKQEG